MPKLISVGAIALLAAGCASSPAPNYPKHHHKHHDIGCDEITVKMHGIALHAFDLKAKATHIEADSSEHGDAFWPNLTFNEPADALNYEHLKRKHRWLHRLGQKKDCPFSIHTAASARE